MLLNLNGTLIIPNKGDRGYSLRQSTRAVITHRGIHSIHAPNPNPPIPPHYGEAPPLWWSAQTVKNLAQIWAAKPAWLTQSQWNQWGGASTWTNENGKPRSLTPFEGFITLMLLYGYTNLGLPIRSNSTAKTNVPLNDPSIYTSGTQYTVGPLTAFDSNRFLEGPITPADSQQTSNWEVFVKANPRTGLIGSAGGWQPIANGGPATTTEASFGITPFLKVKSGSVTPARLVGVSAQGAPLPFKRWVLTPQTTTITWQ